MNATPAFLSRPLPFSIVSLRFVTARAASFASWLRRSTYALDRSW